MSGSVRAQLTVLIAMAVAGVPASAAAQFVPGDHEP